jgi:two-component system, LuxR family, response regulator FixJ
MKTHTLQPTVFIIAQCEMLHTTIKDSFIWTTQRVMSYYTAESFLKHYSPNQPGCLLLDLHLPDMTGLELHQYLLEKKIVLPVIILASNPDVSTAVQALKAKVFDFIEKPFNEALLKNRIQEAIQFDIRYRCQTAYKEMLLARLETLTTRQHVVMTEILKGHSNKKIAEKLEIAQRTVEHHRVRVMEKMGAKHLVELIHIALFCGLVPEPCQLICKHCEAKNKS